MRLLGSLLVRIPHRWLMALGAALGALLWALGIRRRVVLENLGLAFPERSEEDRRRIARATYRNLGQMVFDFLRVPALPVSALDAMFDIEGWDAVERARARGNGVIAATGHYGNFEVLAAAMTRRGVPISMITRQMGKSGANDLWRKARSESGVEDLQVRKGETLKAATRSIKSGRVLGYVIDQNQPLRRAIFPTFFGVPAATAATPAILAKRTGAAVIFTVSFPIGGGRHKVIIEGPIDPPDTGDRERDTLLFMQALNDRLEHWVRQHPEQWYWLHRRWKTRPAADAGLAAPAGSLTTTDGAR
jgi:Kdo2-lipid IVA lauroyltransferase/acyltransferase